MDVQTQDSKSSLLPVPSEAVPVEEDSDDEKEEVPGVIEQKFLDKEEEGPESWQGFQYPPDDETVPKSRLESAARVREAALSYNPHNGKWYHQPSKQYVPHEGVPGSRLQQRVG